MEKWVGMTGTAPQWFKSYLNLLCVCQECLIYQCSYYLWCHRGDYSWPFIVLRAFSMLPLRQVMWNHKISFHLCRWYSVIYVYKSSRPLLKTKKTADVLTRTKKYYHISPVLASLHWLPVASRIDFKFKTFVFKAQIGLPSLYISDLLSPYTLACSLRAADWLLLMVPGFRVKTEESPVLPSGVLFSCIYVHFPIVFIFSHTCKAFCKLVKKKYYIIKCIIIIIRSRNCHKFKLQVNYESISN